MKHLRIFGPGTDRERLQRGILTLIALLWVLFFVNVHGCNWVIDGY